MAVKPTETVDFNISIFVILPNTFPLPMEKKKKKMKLNLPNDVCIVGVARTPMGNFMGQLSSFTAIDLGAITIEEALKRANVPSALVEEVFFGNVCSAGLGQAPARQAALKAGIPTSAPATTINKVCASGMKATTLGCQSILLGLRDIVVTGGMESMSSVPHLLSSSRKGCKYGDIIMLDGIKKDGLEDAYEEVAMGEFGERCAQKYGLSRLAQDQYAAESYKRALEASNSGKFENEIVPLIYQLPKGKENRVIKDEEVFVREVTVESISQLQPAFKKEGTITAANASPISDGACALVLVSRRKASELGLSVIATIAGFGDAAQDPGLFTTSPSLAIPKALSHANLELKDIDYFEINEAFSVVAMANSQILNLDPKKVNVYGGAVSMGHPLGSSGARIIATLCSVLKQEGGRFGCAAVCNGGGGASAIVLEIFRS